MSSTDNLSDNGAFPCAIRAWNHHEQTVLKWLLKETGNPQLSQDLLQELFIRIMQQQQNFCQVDNTKAWMFRVAKNLMLDHVRNDRYQAFNQDLEQEEDITDTIDLLAISCLPRVLSELDAASRDILVSCDLQGTNQQAYADEHQLSLPAVKSRIRRAREKLRNKIALSCQVKFDDNQNICCFNARSTHIQRPKSPA